MSNLTIIKSIDELNEVFSDEHLSLLQKDKVIWAQLNEFFDKKGELNIWLNHSHGGGSASTKRISIKQTGSKIDEFNMLTLAHELSHALEYSDQHKNPNRFATAQEYNQARTMGEAWANLREYQFYKRNPSFFSDYKDISSIENVWDFKKYNIYTFEKIDSWIKYGLSEDKILEELAKLNCGMTGSGKDNYEDWSWTYEQKNNNIFLMYNTTLEQELKEAERILGRQITSEYGMKSLLKFGLFDGYDKAVGSNNIFNAGEILKYRPEDAGALQLLMWGGGGDDQLYGWKYGDILIGGEGSDFLYGREGNDALLGGIGQDYLYGESGSDTLYGGDDVDYLWADGRGDQYTDTGSTDALYGGEGNDYLFASDGGKNYLDGGEGADHLYGGYHVHGQGADYFYADYEDNIYNFSGRGEVYLKNKKLSGGEWNEETQQYEGGGHTYKVDGTTLIIDGKLKIHDFILPGTAFVPGGTYEGLSIKLGPFENEDTPDTTESENRRCPIILDLDKNGIITSGLGNHFFDYDGDGLREKTAWVGKGDGILVRDLNNDGIINNGSELFGDSTLLQNGQKASNGFEALAQLDSNNDGIIDHKDAAFNTLKVWVDANGNGFTEEGELKTLSELGIASIKTGYTNSSYIDVNGNAHKQQGEFTFADGTSSTTADVWFKTQTSSRIEDSDITLSADIILMPNAKAFGTVHDLHQAMALDVSLKDLLTAVIDEADASKRSVLLDNLIYRWTGSDSVAANSRGSYIDARIVVALEHLVGKDYINIESGKNPNSQAAKLLDVEYDKFKRYVEATILAQTRYGLQWSVITSGFDSASGGITVSSQGLGNKIYSLLETNQFQTLKETLSVIDNLHLYSSGDYAQKKKEFLSSVNQNIPATFSDEQRRLFNDILTKANSVFGTNGADSLIGSVNDDIIVGGAGDDIITDTSGNNSLYGEAGNDTLTGTGSFTGGTGNDIIHAKTAGASDTFYFNLGDGQDIVNCEDAGIKNGYYNQYGQDKIVFGEGITQDMIAYRVERYDLILIIGNQGDQMTFKNYYDNKNQTVKQIEFADGSVLEGDLDKLFATYIGTDQADNIFISLYTNNVKTILAGAGDDVIVGAGVISGGTGNDSIALENRYDDNGQSVASTILFNLGDGQDTISYANQKYTISFGEGITAQMLRFEMETADRGHYFNSNLIIKIGDQGEQITLTNYLNSYNMDYHGTVSINFADGTVWTDINEKLPIFTTYGSDAENTLIGSGVDDIIYGGAGNDTIIDYRGNNYLDGGVGDDALEGTGTFYGGKGNDTIKLDGETQQNTILFNLGDGQDTINADGGSGRDRILFGQGITQEMVLFTADTATGDIVIKVGGQGDQITLSRYTAFTDAYETIRYFEFADGSVLDWQKLRLDLFGQVYTNGYDKIHGTTGRDYIIALDGDDEIWDEHGRYANLWDAIWAEEGAYNYIDAGAGNDFIVSWGTIIGGKGDDYLSISGGTRGNIVMFNLGDGKDQLVHSDHYTSYACNTIRFGSDVTADMISFRYGEYSDLIVRVGNQGDQITISSYFYRESRYGYTGQTFSRFEFADGTVWEDIREEQQFRDYIDSDKTVLTFNLGDGQDEFSNNNSQGERLEKIIFGAGISAQMIRYQKVSETDLVILIGQQGDQLTLKNYFSYSADDKGIKQIEFADGTVWGNDFLQKASMLYVQKGTNAADNFWGDNEDNAIDNAIYGLAGNDTIVDNFGNNYLDGGAGNDKITGRGTFVGGSGNDTIYAQQTGSADTFIFNLGDGQDILYTTDSSKAADKIVFGAGISASMIRYQKSGNDLTIIIGQNGDQMTFKNYYSNSNNQTVKQIEFADGTTWGSDFLQKAKLLTVQKGTSAANTLTGGSGDDAIYGEAGNDTITDNAGNNYLDGGAGIDKITGRGTFNGGLGADTLYAQQNGSADTFLFNRGDGKDIIYSQDTLLAADKIVFGQSVTTSMVSHTKSGYNLILNVNGTTDQITIMNYFKGGQYQTINRLEFADGTVWQANGKTDATFGYDVTQPVQASAAVMGQVNNLISAMAAFAPEAGSSSMLPTNQYDPSTVLLGASAA